MNKDVYNLKAFHQRAIWAICLLAVIIYSNSLNCAFVFDDRPNITENAFIRLTKLCFEKISAAAFKSPHVNRPAANVSFAVNYYFGRYNPAGYHVVNILIHIINGILVYFFTLVTLRQAGIAAPKRFRFPHSFTAYISLFAAMIFVAHPLQVQSTTYIVQRMNSMAVMFYLLSLLFYIGGRSTTVRWKQWIQWTGCLLSWILALGCKEIAATLPLVLLLYEWYFLQNFSKDRLKQHLKYCLGLLVVLGLVAYMFLGSNPLEYIAGSFTQRDFTLEERVLTQFRVLVFYLSLFFYPHPLRLNLLHHITVSHSLLDPVTTLVSLVMLLSLLVFAVYIAKKQRLVSFCILWFFIHLMIESSIIGLELIFEHRLYLPMVGLAVMTAYLLFHFVSAHRTWPFIVFIAIIISLGTATHLRNRIWQNPVSLWYDVILKSPQSSRAHYNLGSELMQQGRLVEAVDHLSEALKLKPDDTKAHNNLGLVLFEQEDLEKAVHHFSAALRIQPGNSAAHYNLGLVMAKKGHLEAAATHYLEALRIKPDFAAAHNNLGSVLHTQGRFKEAVYHLSAALKIRPDYAEAHHNMGYALEMLGDVKKAIDHYLAALEIRADDARTYNHLGAALMRQGMLSEAVRCYQKALELKPDDAGTHNNLGVVLQRQGKSKLAIDRYMVALRLNPDYAEAHNNLGIALASQGRFKEAADHFHQALRIRPDDSQARHNLSLISSQKDQTQKEDAKHSATKTPRHKKDK